MSCAFLQSDHTSWGKSQSSIMLFRSDVIYQMWSIRWGKLHGFLSGLLQSDCTSWGKSRKWHIALSIKPNGESHKMGIMPCALLLSDHTRWGKPQSGIMPCASLLLSDHTTVTRWGKLQSGIMPCAFFHYDHTIMGKLQGAVLQTDHSTWESHKVACKCLVLSDHTAWASHKVTW